MIVCAHQPNLLPGASVISKLQASHAVIWLDEVQYTKNGWTNRNRLPDGRWLTVPVERHCAFKPINRVRIGDPARDWRKPLCLALRRTWPCVLTDELCSEIGRSYRLLVGLNVALLRVLLRELAPDVVWVFQSHLDAGHAVQAVSEQAQELLPISERLAMMTAELGGDVYLSGPSGRRYLDEDPFHERGIDVAYWRHDGPNPCALELIGEPAAH